MKCKETRSAAIAAADDLVLEGYPVVFESPTTIHTPTGDYTEVIHRGALDGCDLHDSTLIYNHDDSRIPLARSNKTMLLEVTERGLHMVATLAGDSQQAREVYTSVKRGDLSGMSFSFVVPDGGSRYDGATNTRHIDRIQKVYECSICPHPAYAETSVEARDAMTAARDVARQGTLNRAARIQALIRADRIIKESV